MTALLIAGPTASGKSDIALDLAERFGGTIINADASQVYRDLRILTARPSAADEARVPHRLYGTVDGAEVFSVARWLAAVAPAIEQAHAQGRLPILVGGTGLYFTALTEGIAAVPEIPADIRQALRTKAASVPSESLYADLRTIDPSSAERLRPSDRQRILRALEVMQATGRSLTQWQLTRTGAVLRREACRALVVAPQRSVLHASAAQRFRGMIGQGALDEVAALLARRLDPALPVMKALGVGALAAHLQGVCDLEAAVERATIDTRRYIKRQFTWLRGQMGDWTWAPPEVAAAVAARLLQDQAPASVA